MGIRPPGQHRIIHHLTYNVKLGQKLLHSTNVKFASPTLSQSQAREADIQALSYLTGSLDKKPLNNRGEQENKLEQPSAGLILATSYRKESDGQRRQTSKKVKGEIKADEQRRGE